MIRQRNNIYKRQNTFHFEHQRKEKSQSNQKSVSQSKKRPQSCTHNYRDLSIKTGRCILNTQRTRNYLSPQNRNIRSPKNQNRQSYQQKIQKPKSLSQQYVDQTFFYRKLHDKRLWQWNYNQQFCQLQKTPTSRPCKVNTGVLERFRDHMEKKVGKRVPLVVKDIFQRKPAIN